MSTKSTEAEAKARAKAAPRAADRDPDLKVRIVDGTAEAPAEHPDMPKAVEDGGGQPSPLHNDTRSTPSSGDGTSGGDAPGAAPAPVAPAADMAGKGETKVMVASKDATNSPLVLTVNGQALEVPLDRPVALTEPFLEALRNAGINYFEV